MARGFRSLSKEELLLFIFLIALFLTITTLVLVMAQVPTIKALPGGALFGNYLILLFLASGSVSGKVARYAGIFGFSISRYWRKGKP